MLSIEVRQDIDDEYAADVQRKNTMNVSKEEVVNGTWNVRTLNRECILNELEYNPTRYRWNIIGITEMGCLGSGEPITDEGYNL